MKMFFAPDGTPITTTAGVSFNSPNIEVDEEAGTAGLGHFDDFPNFEHLELPGLGNVLIDSDGTDWLEQHCRLIEVDDAYDVYSSGAEVRLAWDDEIVAACKRVEYLGRTLWGVKKLRDWSPPDVRDDPTINAALDHIVVGRVQVEIDGLQAKIANYRVGRVEPTVLELDEETEDAEA